MSSLTWRQGFCAMIVIVWRITFPPRRNCGGFPGRLVVGRVRDSGPLAFPHSLALKKRYFGLASQAFKVFLVCLDVKFDTCMLYMSLILRQGQANY